MNKNKTTYFISDLHLEEGRENITTLFLKFLKTLAPESTLYILGDFFEAWIGDDEKTLFHTTIIQALQTATEAGLTIYFMHGNRDFLIGKIFLQQSGCRLLPEKHLIELDHKKILLMHGDTLCTRDLSYLRLRKILLHPLFQFIFLSLPLNFRKKLSQKLRATSKSHTQTLSPDIMDVTESEVDRVIASHQADYLIHGHTHRPKTYDKRIVLGAWHETGSILIHDAEGNFKLIEIS